MSRTIAAVAGASRGAGKGTALALGEMGATVYVLARSAGGKTTGSTPGTIEETAREVEERGGRAIPLRCDCTDAEQIQAALEQIEQEQGCLDILVNAAWGAHDIDPPTGQFYEHAETGWEYMFNRGVRNYLLTACRAIPLLKKSRKALLANISFWDEDRYTGDLLYDLAKNAMNRMIYGMSVELKNTTVTPIALSPGYMRTEKVMETLEKNPSMAERFGEPGETPLYTGRAVAALYRDRRLAERSGKAYRAGDLARELLFTDEDGSRPAAFRLPQQ